MVRIQFKENLAFIFGVPVTHKVIFGEIVDLLQQFKEQPEKKRSGTINYFLRLQFSLDKFCKRIRKPWQLGEVQAAGYQRKIYDATVKCLSAFPDCRIIFMTTIVYSA